MFVRNFQYYEIEVFLRKFEQVFAEYLRRTRFSEVTYTANFLTVCLATANQCNRIRLFRFTYKIDIIASYSK